MLEEIKLLLGNSVTSFSDALMENIFLKEFGLHCNYCCCGVIK